MAVQVSAQLALLDLHPHALEEQEIRKIAASLALRTSTQSTSAAESSLQIQTDQRALRTQHLKRKMDPSSLHQRLVLFASSHSEV
jgi:hypothetical protein